MRRVVQKAENVDAGSQGRGFFPRLWDGARDRWEGYSELRRLIKEETPARAVVKAWEIHTTIAARILSEAAGREKEKNRASLLYMGAQKAYEQLAETYEKNKRHAYAAHCLSAAAGIAETREDICGAITLHLRAAKAYKEFNYVLAARHYRNASRLAQEIGDYYQAVEIYKIRAELHAEFKKIQSALRCLSKAAEIAEERLLMPGRAVNILARAAEITDDNSSKQDFARAAQMLNKAAGLAKKAGEHEKAKELHGKVEELEKKFEDQPWAKVYLALNLEDVMGSLRMMGGTERIQEALLQ